MRSADDAQREHRELRQLRAAVDNVLDAIVIVDDAAALQFSNRAADELLGAARPPLGDPALTIVHPDDQEQVIGALADLATRPGDRGSADFRVRTRTGWTWVEAAATNLLQDPDVAGIVVSFRNLTHVRALEELARSDALTGLANRATLEERLLQELARARATNEPLAVLFVDLDDFKLVNDSLGHRVGDELLALVAARLRGLVRDIDLIARFGGDEFVLLLPGAGASVAASLAERVTDALAGPFALADTEVTVGASIGIAVHIAGETGAETGHETGSHAGPHGEDLLRDADIAMYAAKAARVGTRLFTADLRDAMQDGLRLSAELRSALDRAEPDRPPRTGSVAAQVPRDDFHVDYEPMRRLDDGSIAGVLVQTVWNHPRLGPIRSRGFRAAAARARMLHLIHARTVAAAGAARQELDRIGHTRVPVLVELDARLLGRRQLLEETLAALGSDRIRDGSLQFELDDGATHAVGDATLLRGLSELRGAGFGVALANVGGRGIPVALPGRLPIDRLGLDARMLDAPPALLVATVRFAAALGMITSASGIATVAQRHRLTDAGGTCGRGPLLGAPAGRIVTLLDAAIDIRQPSDTRKAPPQVSSGPRGGQ